MNVEMIITGFLLFGAMLITSKKYKVTGFYLSLVGCVIGLCFFLYLHLNYMAIGCVSGCALSVVNISRHY
jgi:hypothetical protein